MSIGLQRPTRLGTRLALSYICLLAAAMSVFTVGTAAVLFFQMRAQLAHYAVEDIETVEGLLAISTNGKLTVRDDYHNHPESKRVLEHYLEVLQPDGVILYRNDRLAGRDLGARPTPGEGVGGYSQRSGTLPDGTRIVMVSRRHSLDGHPLLIRLAHSEEPVWHAVTQFLLAAALTFPIMIAASAFAGYRMARRILQPVQSMATRAAEITSSRLHERLPVHGTGDELDHLAVAFNHTLTRLDESFRQLRQFTSDASHELRTPLAAIRSMGEVALVRDRTREEYRELLGSILEEVNRLTRLVDELLLISRGDSGVIKLNCRAIGIFQLAQETITLLEPLAGEKQQILALTGDEQAKVEGDPVFLRQALINVLDNAIKYSPEGTTISLHVAKETGESVCLSIEDCGPGIAPEHLAHIFDRFYRADPGRSRNGGGFGLGLSIAQWAIHAHHGQIDVSSTLDAGSTFRITLPVHGSR